MPELSIEERVAAGAAWLDAEVPGWLDLIVLPDLQLSSGCNCVLGQTFGDFDDAPLPASTRREHHVAAWPLGFQSREVAEAYGAGRKHERAVVAAEYAELETEWRRLILARREAAA